MALSGCADVRTGRSADELERAAAAEQVDQLLALTELARTPRHGSVLLAAVDFAPALTLVGPDGLPVALPSRRGDDLHGCVVTTGNATTFSECEVHEHVLDGSVSHRPGNTTAELVDVFVIDDNHHGAATIDAWLERDAAGVSGTVDVDAVWTAGDGDHVLDATVRVDGLVVDRAGCAVAGTLTITGTVDGAESRRTLWFGPGCGDLSIHP
jgi:hypothetical protein